MRQLIIECISKRIQGVSVANEPFKQWVIHGVLQGSVLCPILLYLHINDNVSVCCGNAKLQLCADDTKIYSSVNIDDISVSLQQSLVNLSS